MIGPTTIAPGVGTKRWEISTLFSGMKESYACARIEQGRSEWWSAGRTYRSAPGAIQLMKPGDIHRDLSRDGASVIHFVCFDIGLVANQGQVQRQLEPSDPRAAVFHRLHDAINAGATGLALEIAVTEALAAFSSLDHAKLDLTRPVQRAVELLRARHTETVTLDELSSHAGLDKFHLCRAFRRQIGLPPHAYQTRLRIMQAKQLLRGGVRPSEIAPRVGFYDQSALNRHFRRIVGVTPGQFAARR